MFFFLSKEQSELLWKYKDALRKEVPNEVLKELLEHNQQKIATGESHVCPFLSLSRF